MFGDVNPPHESLMGFSSILCNFLSDRGAGHETIMEGFSYCYTDV